MEKKSGDRPLSARLDADVQRGLDAAIEKAADGGERINRTTAVNEALRAWLGQREHGAIYPTERERLLFVGLRKLIDENPAAYSSLLRLVEAVCEHPLGVDLMERMAPLMDSYLSTSQEHRRTDEEP